MTSSLLDLVLPRECGGCGRPGTAWCAECRDVLSRPPRLVRPRVVVGAPCWALGTYGGTCRSVVVAAKERGRRDLAGPLGDALAGAVRCLQVEGELDPPELAPVILVPAPSRRRAARSRGGDPVARACRRAAGELGSGAASVSRVLVMGSGVRDSVGLSARERAVNLRGRIRVRGSVRGSVVLVDDVLTTGTTAAESVAALGNSGIRVDAVLVVAAVR